MRLLSDLSVWQQLWTVTLGSPRGPPGSCLPTPQEPGCLGSELGWGHEVCSEVTELGSHPGSRLSASLPVEHFSSIEPSIPPQDALRALGGTTVSAGLPWTGGPGTPVVIITPKGATFTPLSAPLSLQPLELTPSLSGFDHRPWHVRVLGLPLPHSDIVG